MDGGKIEVILQNLGKCSSMEKQTVLAVPTHHLALAKEYNGNERKITPES